MISFYSPFFLFLFLPFLLLLPLLLFLSHLPTILFLLLLAYFYLTWHFAIFIYYITSFP